MKKNYILTNSKYYCVFGWLVWMVWFRWLVKKTNKYLLMKPVLADDTLQHDIISDLQETYDAQLERLLL